MSKNQAIVSGWKKDWDAFEDATYLNTAAQAVMPRVAVEAAQFAIEAKRFPHRVGYSTWFEVPNRLRASLSKMIRAKPEEIALTSGASTGLAEVAHGLAWNAGDEVITAKGEFPLQYATWKPMERREGLTLKIVTPRDRFIVADDLIAAITPKTRVISVSHVRFDDGSMLDAPRLAAACHERGVMLVLDVTQSCGAMPLDVNELGADFLVCAGYKWLLGPYGTGFFWVKSTHLDALRPGPFYWKSQTAELFSTLNFVDPEPARSAKRWDVAESSTYFNFNLVALDASVNYVSQIGPALVLEHNRKLIGRLFDHLPKHCVPASPLDPSQRGSYGCFVAGNPDQTMALYQKLSSRQVVVSMREGRIRVSPHLFNSEQDIDRLLNAVAS